MHYYKKNCELGKLGERVVRRSLLGSEPIEGRDGQEKRGDITWGWLNVEVKTEKTYTGNLFIEEWSNRKWDEEGWFRKLTECDYLFYLFINPEEKVFRMFVAPFERIGQHLKLCQCGGELKRVNSPQKNDTWGYTPSIDCMIASNALFELPFMSKQEPGTCLSSRS